MMNLIADNLRLRWRLSWPGSLAVSGARRKEVGQADPAKRMQPRQNAGVEKSDDVLEGIWRAADRKRPKANFTLGSGLVRKLRVALTGMRADVFGACLCCKAPLGLRRLTAAPWTPLCIRCQEAADRDDAEVLRIRSRN
jgi:RNA polymerase-binding transcription factor DksA